MAASDKERLFLCYLISSPELFAITHGIIKPSYFEPEYRKAVAFMEDYFDKYKTLPSLDQIYAETDLELNKKKIQRDEFDYAVAEIEAFCRKQAITEAILVSAEILDRDVDDITHDEFAKIETNVSNAVNIAVIREIGASIFDDTDELFEDDDADKPMSTLWHDYDEATDGGIFRKELSVFTANSGVGKSNTMYNVAKNLASQGYNGIIISLELYRKTITKRLGSMLTQISQRELRTRKSEVVNAIKALKDDYGKLVIHNMPVGTTPSQLRAYLKEFELQEGFSPDFIVIDYLDLMSPNERVSADNVFEKDKRIAEQLRQILVDYNAAGISASQQNRSAVALDASEVNQSHIAGGISKINTSDVVISIIMTDVMRAAGEIAFHFLKTRNSSGVGSTIYKGWNRDTLTIYNKTIDRKEMSSELPEPSKKADKKISILDAFDVD
jgi:KaiC/GvpD/RAD55 family RecA-like ATPase